MSGGRCGAFGCSLGGGPAAIGSGEEKAGVAAPRSWAFVTKHAQVLLALARQPGARVADLAEAAQLTDRGTYRILADLQRAGYVTRQKLGRRNRYVINDTRPLDDPLVEATLVADLLALLPAASHRPTAEADR